MANYLGWEITNKGRELLARAMNNETKINVTKFKIGAGYNTGNDRELTDLLDKRNEFPINSYERKGNGNVEFTFIVSNKTGSGTSAITNSYKISEMGIYARDDFGTEILYAYNKGTDGDYIPVFNGKNAIDIMEKCIIVVDQSANLNVTIDSSNTYITRDSAERNYIKKTDYATENKAGIVTLGTTANTALEGKRLAEILGIEFGGKIQDSGIKTAGKFYYDIVTKFYYECIVNNSLTYNDSSKFRAISNKPLSDRLENLYEKRAGFTRVGQTLIQWGYIENPSTNATLNYPVSFKEGTLPIVTIANWVNTELIVLTTQNNRFCSFRSSKAISLNWIAVGIA